MNAKLKLTCSVILIFALMTSLTWATVRKDDKKTETPDYSNIIENIDFTLPEDQGFKLGFNLEDSLHWLKIYYPKGQSSYKWTEMVWHEYLRSTMLTINLPGTAREKYLDARKLCPDATWDIISKSGKEAKYPSIIFQISCPKYLNPQEPADIQIWKLIAGKTGLFVAQWSYRGKEIPKDKKEMIVKQLELTKIVSEEKK